jgi:hypothetical protein
MSKKTNTKNKISKSKGKKKYPVITIETDLTFEELMKESLRPDPDEKIKKKKKKK